MRMALQAAAGVVAKKNVLRTLHKVRNNYSAGRSYLQEAFFQLLLGSDHAVKTLPKPLRSPPTAPPTRGLLKRQGRPSTAPALAACPPLLSHPAPQLRLGALQHCRRKSSGRGEPGGGGGGGNMVTTDYRLNISNLPRMRSRRFSRSVGRCAARATPGTIPACTICKLRVGRRKETSSSDNKRSLPAGGSTS